MTRYHLWLTSAGECRAQLIRVMDQLCFRFHTSRFEPHVTLVGGIEGDERMVCEQARGIAQPLKPFRASFVGLGYEDEYFRCLYCQVAPTHEILSAYGQATRTFPRNPQRPFQPHVSLLYGFVPLPVKQEMMNALSEDLPDTFSVTALKAVRTESSDPKDWQVIQDVQL